MDFKVDIQEWGDSLIIRIPKKQAKLHGYKIGDVIDVTISKEKR